MASPPPNVSDKLERTIRPSGGSFVRVDDVSHSYTNPRFHNSVLEKINLHVAAGEFVSVLGPNGCGKTTLLRIIAGLIEPTAGVVRIDERHVRGPSPNVGFLFQRPVLLPWRTLLQNLSLPIQLSRKYRTEDRERSLSLLEMCKLTSFRDAFPREVSGGMQQMASFCMALMLDPGVLLMDEPFGSLDALTKEDLWIQLQAVYRVLPKTIVFVTHDINEAILLADRAVILSTRPGRVTQIINVPLSRPRSPDLLKTAEYQRLANRARDALTDAHSRNN